MTPTQKENLLRYAWQRGAFGPLTAEGGEPVSVRFPGRPEAGGDELDFVDAEICVGNVRCRGGVKVFDRTSDWNAFLTAGHTPPVALLVVAVHDAPAAACSGREPLPVVVLRLSDRLIRAYESLIAPGNGLCGNCLAGYDEVRRYSLLTRLVIERLQAKSEHVSAVFQQQDRGWNDTAFCLMLDTVYIAHAANRRQCGLLAQRIREASLVAGMDRPEQVEALLFGASGLLDLVREPDDYIYSLRQQFDAIARNYAVTPLDANRWTFGSPGNSSSLWTVMAQLAAFFFHNKNLSTCIAEAETLDDIRALFAADVSPYWQKHDYPGAPERDAPVERRFSGNKTDLFIINFILPFRLFYDEQKAPEESTIDRLVEHLEQIPPEDNVYIRQWTPYLRIDNALKSQAVVQLAKKYCNEGLCHCCPLGASFLSAAVG